MKSSPSLRLTERHPRKFPFYRWRGRVIYRFKAGWAYVPGHLGKVSWGMWWMHNMAGAQGLYGPGDGTAATSTSVTSTNHRTVKLIFAVWKLSYVGIAICLCPWTHGNEIYTLTGGSWWSEVKDLTRLTVEESSHDLGVIWCRNYDLFAPTNF